MQRAQIHAFPRVHRRHQVFILQQSPLHVVHARLSHRTGLQRALHERRVGRNEVMKARGSHQSGHHAHKIAVYIAGIAKRRGRHGENVRHQRVDLGNGEAARVALLGDDGIERCIIKNHCTVRELGEARESQDAVVGLRYHVGGLFHAWKHRIGLNELVRKGISEMFEQVGSHSRPSASSDGVSEHETLQNNNDHKNVSNTSKLSQSSASRVIISKSSSLCLSDWE